MTNKDGKEARRAFGLLMGLSILTAFFIALIVLASFMTLPGLSGWVDGTFNDGIGLKWSALISAIVSILVLVGFAVTSGEGLIGEIQFMISGFFLFFCFFWLLIAWVF